MATWRRRRDGMASAWSDAMRRTTTDSANRTPRDAAELSGLPARVAARCYDHRRRAMLVWAEQSGWVTRGMMPKPPPTPVPEIPRQPVAGG